jgi:carbohydrate-selective porin OprB
MNPGNLKASMSLLASLCIFAFPAEIATAQDTDLRGPDAHEIIQGLNGHLLGDWGGKRSQWEERGVDFDFHYITDSLWNIESLQKERLASWNRGRGTVDIDFGELVGWHGLHFHATGLWQGGGNLGTYLALETSPSGMSSENTFRLDSWWVEKQWFQNRLNARIGQIAGQDFFGTQQYGTSFVFEPMSYALPNLSTTYETGSPATTPGLQLTVVPLRHVYLASMVMAGDKTPFAHNPTGFAPQFKGAPVSAYEIGFTPGNKGTTIRPGDNVATRRGYAGFYKVGATYNPGKFMTRTGATTSGNYLLYWMANQALWRVDPLEGRGLDATFAYDWSPPSLNSTHTALTAGLRFNEPLPLPVHNTMSLGYVWTRMNPQFSPPGVPPNQAEHGVEFNALFNIKPTILFQPAIQYYANVGGGPQRAVVLGFRAKVEF